MKIQDSKHKYKTAWSVFLTCIIFVSIIHFPTCTYCFIVEHYFMQGIREGGGILGA